MFRDDNVGRSIQTRENVSFLHPVTTSRPAVRFIGIAGGPGAGKSNIANALMRVVPAIGLLHMGKHFNSVTPDKIAAAIADLKTRGETRIYGFMQFANVIHVTASPIMILVGQHVFSDPRVADLIDLKVYVDCDLDKALLTRMTAETNRRDCVPNIARLIDHHNTVVRPGHAAIAAQATIANIVVPNAHENGGKAIDLLISWSVHS
jgi:uridine kinase